MTNSIEDLLFSTEQVRQLFKQSDEKRDEGLPKKIPEVERFDNILYGKDPVWNILDIYLPKKRNRNVPIIINFHGGGYVYGTKETYQFYGMSLAKQGFGFVNITYRLAPEVVFPEELNDINDAIHWISHHLEEYDLDGNNVFFVGDSAGGQMALQYLTILCNPKFQKLFGYEHPKLAIRAAAINCGATFLNLPGTISGPLEAYFPIEIQKEFSEHLKTEEYLTKECPPLYIMTSSNDFIRDHSIRLQGFLIAKKIEHEFHSYGNFENPRNHVFHCDIRDEIANQCNLDELNFFRKYLK